MLRERRFENLPIVDNHPESVQVVEKCELERKHSRQKKLEGGERFSLPGQRDLLRKMGTERLAPQGRDFFRPALERPGIRAEFAHRHDLCPLDLGDRALRIEVKSAQRFQPVAEKFQSHGMFHLRWKHIQYAAAMRKLP